MLMKSWHDICDLFQNYLGCEWRGKWNMTGMGGWHGASYAVGSEADGWGKRPCQKVGDRLRFQSLIPGEGVTYREKPVF